jgi:hypothetical protein
MASFIAQSGPQICCNNDVFGQKSNAVTDRLHQNQGAKQTPDLAALGQQTSEQQLAW